MGTILVIDDDVLFRRLIRRVLSLAGHTVIEASDGLEGIGLAQRHRPNLIITDILMPKKEGIETIMEIRRTMPQTKILAVSGSAADYLSMAEALGADSTLEKPFLPAKLTEIVSQLIG